MPTWGQVLAEVAALAESPPADLPKEQNVIDVVRRRYLQKHHELTGRNVILYASRWTNGGPADPRQTMMTLGDMEGLMNAMQGLSGTDLDLVLHLPGGQAEAAERVGNYLRTRFTHIRVIVPLAAMSAATMLACVGNSIVLGKHSCLGPIDPQFILGREGGARAMPAHAILEQFDRAKREIALSPVLTNAWMHILKQIDPSILVECELAQELAREFVAGWLENYMLPNNIAVAHQIARTLADHSAFKSHSRSVDRDAARKMGLVIENLENDPNLQDAVLSAYHAASLTLTSTPVVKIIENHKGAAWLVHGQQRFVVPVVEKPAPQPVEKQPAPVEDRQTPKEPRE